MESPMDIFPISGLNDKDKGAWKVLFDHYYPALCNYVQHMLGDGESAKDIVQEIFVNIWKSDRRFVSERELTRYLYRACYNNTLIFLRNNNIRNGILEKIGAEQAISTEELYAVTLREEVLRQLYVHINNLSPEQRKVILLSIEGYSWEEIAQKLEVSINTVKTHRSRAFKYLRSKMRNKMYLLLLW